MEPSIKTYDIKEKVDGVGDLVGRVEVYAKPFAPKSILVFSRGDIMVEGNYSLDYSKVPRLSNYEGRIKAEFLLPTNVPVNETWPMMLLNSPELDGCLVKVHEVLEEIIKTNP